MTISILKDIIIVNEHDTIDAEWRESWLKVYEMDEMERIEQE